METPTIHDFVATARKEYDFYNARVKAFEKAIADGEHVNAETLKVFRARRDSYLQASQIATTYFPRRIEDMVDAIELRVAALAPYASV